MLLFVNSPNDSLYFSAEDINASWAKLFNFSPFSDNLVNTSVKEPSPDASLVNEPKISWAPSSNPLPKFLILNSWVSKVLDNKVVNATNQNGLYIGIAMEVDPSWKKIGQLEKI